MDVAFCVGRVGLVVRRCSPHFLDLRRPSVVHDAALKLDLENETTLCPDQSVI